MKKSNLPMFLTVGGAVAVCVVSLVVVLANGRRGDGDTASRPDGTPAAAAARPAPAAPSTVAQPAPADAMDPVEPDPDGGEDVEEPESEPAEEDKAAAEEERLVEAFDGLTDRWREPLPEGRAVTMDDIDEFAASFRSLPEARREECLHRALNLVPDDNVMLLAGILLDKSLDTELVELVFNDVLNRDESCKKPILEEIFRDKTHPCWADTAWILDVTGEIPAPGGDSDEGGEPD